MSKFYNQTRQADEWATSPGALKDSEVPALLEAVTRAGGALKTDTRLGRCRKLTLPKPLAARIVFGATNPEPVAMEAYRTLRTRLLRFQSNTSARSIVLSSASAHEGKTLTSMNLALCCAQLHDFRVLLVDGDLRTGGLGALTGETTGPGLSEILAGRASYEEAICATDIPNLFVLGNGSFTGTASELYTGRQWKEFVTWSTGAFRLVLVDSPPIIPLADFEQISSACDGILMIVRAMQTERALLKSAADRLDPKKLVGVVFNGTNIEKKDYYYYYGEDGRNE